MEELRIIDPGKMYNIFEGVAKDGAKKSIALEGKRLFVYHNQNYKGCFLDIAGAIRRFNDL